MKKHRLHLLACIVTGLLATASVSSAQLVFQPLSEATSKDTKIYSSVPTSNFSSNLSITSPNIGAHFLSLLQFDLSQYGIIPVNQITSAYLTLSVYQIGPNGGIGGDVTVSPILSGWKENAGDAGGDPLATYDAFFGTIPTITFGAPVATTTVNGVGLYTWDITNTVKAWVSGAQANNGVLIQIATPNGDIGINDVDSGGTAGAPSLTVVPEPGSVSILGGIGLLFLMRRRHRVSTI